MKTYAAVYNNNEIRENSSSGGIFSALADKFDVVYGVAMTDDCYGAGMIRVEDDISPLRGSKYFQAKVGDTFNDPGVTATLLDGTDVTSSIITSGTVNTSSIGTYVITYTFGNSKITRNVIVS